MKSCLAISCRVSHDTPGHLAAHLHMEHGWPMVKALDESRRHFGISPMPTVAGASIPRTAEGPFQATEAKVTEAQIVEDIPVHRCPKCDAVVPCEWSAIAAIEEQARRLRIVAGLMRAKLLGKTIGHPKGSHYTFDEVKARELLGSGLSLRATARALEVHPTPISRAFKKK